VFREKIHAPPKSIFAHRCFYSGDKKSLGPIAKQPNLAERVPDAGQEALERRVEAAAAGLIRVV